MNQGQNGGIDGGGIDQRLVALNVDDDVAGFGGGSFRHAVGAGGVVGARHSHLCAEIPCDLAYAFVISGNQDAAKVSRLGGALVNVLQHGAMGDGSENFTGKTSGGKTGGDHAQNFTRHKRSYHKMHDSGHPASRTLPSTRSPWQGGIPPPADWPCSEDRQPDHPVLPERHGEREVDAEWAM